MPAEDKNGSSAPQLSFWNAVVQVIQGLKDQPPLLLVFGLAIILLAAGALAFENLRLIAIVLIALAVLGLVAWIAGKASTLTAELREPPSVEAGKAEAGWRTNIGKDGIVRGGSAKSTGAMSSSSRVKGGDAKAGPGADIKGKLIGGDATVEYGPPEESRPEVKKRKK